MRERLREKSYVMCRRLYAFTIISCMFFLLLMPVFSQENSTTVQERSVGGELGENIDEELVSYSGFVLNVDIPVAYAVVVLEELSMDTFSDEEGEFVFAEVPEGDYTLLIFVEGMDNKEFPINISANSESLRFQVEDVFDDEVFEEEIVIVADQIKDSDGGRREYSKKYLDYIPLKGDDPISLFEQDTGVLSSAKYGLIGNFFPAISSGQIYSQSKEFNVYGSDSAWNRYFYGNIQIPTNNHIANPTTSIITRKAVDSIEIFKGAPTGVYGPGLGGTVVLQPRRDKANYVLLGVSPTDPSVTFSYWFNESLSLFISSRYSLSQFTVLPLAQWIINTYLLDTSLKTKDYSYADAMVSLEYNKENHDVSVQLLSFYDQWVTEARVHLPQGSSTSTSSVNADINSFPIFGAMGISWEMLAGDYARNTVTASFSVYNSSAHSGIIYDTDDSTLGFKYRYAGYSQTIQYKLLNQYEWFVTENMTLTFAAELQYLDLKGKHEDKYDFNSDPEQIFVDVTSATFTISEEIYKVYGFTEYSWIIDKFETRSTLGVTQIIRSTDGTGLDRTFPSLREEVAYTFHPRWRLSFVTSWNPTFMEGSKYIDRQIAEERAQHDNKTKYIKPTYGITSIPKLSWSINDNHKLLLQGFYAYYYNFSGMTDGLVIEHDRESPTGYRYLTPDHGMGMGGSVEWNWDPRYHLYTISYTLGYAMYKVEGYDWLPPANDYRHQIKTSYLFNKLKQFQIGVTGSVYIDNAFTPEQVVERDYGETTAEGYKLLIRVKENLYPYSARSYIPKYDLYINMKGTIVDNRRWQLNYRFQSSNLLGMFFIYGNEIQDDSYEGANNKRTNNRTYNYKFEPILFLENIYLTFEIAIDLPRL